MNVYKLKER